MTLRPAEILLVAREAQERLGGRPVQKVVQPDGRTLLLGFPQAWLLISLDARHGRLHLVEERPAGTGEAAPAFCMLLRKELGGARLAGLRLVAGERACALRFLRGDGERELRLFLYGAGARLVLVAPDGATLGVLGSRRGPEELPPPRADEQDARIAGVAPSREIVDLVRDEIERERRDAALRSALRAVERERAQLGRLADRLAADLARADQIDERRKDAALLLAHLGEVPAGAAEAVLADEFGDGQPRRVALDPRLSPRANADRIFHGARRLERGLAVVRRRLAETRARLDALEERRAGLVAGTLPPEPAPERPPARRREAQAAEPFHRFRSAAGLEILVGKGAERNDDLTFRVARGDDLWLHARDVPGAHVVVLCGRREVDQETLLDAATLAAHHSAARDEGQVDVTYVRRKGVHKARGARVGQVSVAGGKTLRLRVEDQRLRRLLGGDGG